MIKIENVETIGWEPAIRGMRNPMNSWSKSDTDWPAMGAWALGPNDHDLAMRLRNAGTDHRKFMRMIVCYCDITAPLYWWKEFDTYRNGVEKNSCSTMHKIHADIFSMDDFSHEHLSQMSRLRMCSNIHILNDYRNLFLNWNDTDQETKNFMLEGADVYCEPGMYCRKDAWLQMIQLLPSSYNQKRTVMMSYEALANMYHARKNHKLDEWREFCKWAETLPYSELIAGGDTE